jgi:hypothetical protein
MKFLGAVLAALLIVSPAYAQQQVTSPRDAAATGTLTTITTDTVPLTISGGQWATVQFMATVAGTATATAQYSNDGTNWLAAPHAKRLSTVAGNPTQQAISSTVLVANDVWEIVIPANTVKFQLICGATGTPTSVVIRAGAPYVPGTSVIAQLEDASVAFGVAYTGGNLDMAGWSSLEAFLANNDTGGVSRALQVIPRFSDGTTLASGAASSTVNSGAGGSVPMGLAVGTGVQAFLPQRVNVQATAGTGTGGSSRVVVYARR